MEIKLLGVHWVITSTFDEHVLHMLVCLHLVVLPRFDRDVLVSWVLVQNRGE